MDQSLSRLISALSAPDAALLPTDVEEACRHWPFFTLPAAYLLRRQGKSLDPSLRETMLERIAVQSSDPATLFLIAGARDELARFYPAATEAAAPTTDDAISRFLEKYGHSDPAEEALLERMIFNPVPPDYMALLESEEKLPESDASESDTLADLAAGLGPAGLNRTESEPLHEPMPEPEPEPSAPLAEETRPEPEPHKGHRQEPRQSHTPRPAADSSLSESLARIYIRQKRFDKAFEIIHTLSLNNPKKSVYFADQLRYLSRLIALNQS